MYPWWTSLWLDLMSWESQIWQAVVSEALSVGAGLQ